MKFSPPPSDAQHHEARAVELLQAGNVDEAKTELEQALAGFPEYTQARYDLARAHARAGDHASAARDLTRVFEEDFIGTRVQAAEEADLRSFWASADGRALADRKDEYEARYREVIARGLRVILSQESIFFFVPVLRRLGVFDPRTGRFVSTAPLVPRSTRAFALPDLPYGVIVSGEVRARRRHVPGKPFDPGQAVETVSVFAFDTSGAALTKVDLGHVEAESFDLSLAVHSLRIDLHTPTELAPGVHDARYQVTFGQPFTRELFTTRSTPPEGDDVFPAHIDVGYNRWGPTMSATDTRYVYRPSHGSDTAGTLLLPTGESVLIATSVAYHRFLPRILADASGEHVVLLWNAETRQCDDRNIPGRYKLALVTRSSGAVTPLGEGDGEAAAAFDGEGALYVQRLNSVVRVELPSMTETALPGLVRLTEQVHDDPLCDRELAPP